LPEPPKAVLRWGDCASRRNAPTGGTALPLQFVLFLDIPGFAKAHAPNSGLNARDQIARMTQAALECREAQHVYQAMQSGENVNSCAHTNFGSATTIILFHSRTPFASEIRLDRRTIRIPTTRRERQAYQTSTRRILLFGCAVEQRKRRNQRARGGDLRAARGRQLTMNVGRSVFVPAGAQPSGLPVKVQAVRSQGELASDHHDRSKIVVEPPMSNASFRAAIDPAGRHCACRYRASILIAPNRE
jgi:hypothetical protein